MLEFRGVYKKFNLTGAKEDERIALNNLNLQINSGDFVTIIGGNGSGKSTTLNIAAGTLVPDEGGVYLNGVNITKLKEYQRASFFGRVFQDPLKGTAGDMSVLENLEIAYRRGKTHSPIKWGFNKKNKEYFIEQLKTFDLGLETRLNQKVGVMSGGQRQALTLIMAMLKGQPSYNKIKSDYIKFFEGDKEEAKKTINEAFLKAKTEYKENLTKMSKKEAKAIYDASIRKFDLTKQILLLDEHTAALDPKTARKVLELTDKIVKENGLTTLMVTHNMKDALTYGNRIIMFYNGKVILDASNEEKKKLTVEDLLLKFEQASKKAGEEAVVTLQ